MRFLLLQGFARHDLLRCAGRDLAAALRVQGHSALRFDLTVHGPREVVDAAARWAPTAVLGFDAVRVPGLQAPLRVLFAGDAPVVMGPREGAWAALTSEAGLGRWSAVPARVAAPWGAPPSLAEEFPAHAPRPIDVLLAATWRPPADVLNELRARLPPKLGARVMDFCDAWLAGAQAVGSLAPEPLITALARHLDLASLSEDRARSVMAAVLPAVTRWYRSLVLGRALGALAASGREVTLVGDGPWPVAVVRARNIRAIGSMAFEDYRALCGAARVVLDVSPTGGGLRAAPAALMAGARLVAAPIPVLRERLGDAAAEWLSWRDLDALDATLARALADDEARARSQSLARSRLTWEPLARDLARVVAELAPPRISVAA